MAGLLAILSPLLMFLPLFDPQALTEESSQTNAIDADRVGEALAALLPAAGLGLIGLGAAWALQRGWRWAQMVLMAVAMALLGLTIFTAASVGPILVAPAILFVFPALWLQPDR